MSTSVKGPCSAQANSFPLKSFKNEPPATRPFLLFLVVFSSCFVSGKRSAVDEFFVDVGFELSPPFTTPGMLSVSSCMSAMALNCQNVISLDPYQTSRAALNGKGNEG